MSARRPVATLLPPARHVAAAGPAFRAWRERLEAASVPLAIAALAAIVAGAAVLRFWAIDRQGFWYDEAVTAWLLRGTPGQMLAAIPHSESTPPLYYLAAWVWTHVLGDNETGLRSLSALAGTATVAVTYAAGSTLAGRRVGLVAALLVAANPLLVWYSQEGRSYALLVLLTAVSFWLLCRARTRPAPARLIAWAVASAAALATHYFAAFVVAPAGLLLLADRRIALRWRLAANALVIAAAGGLIGLAVTQSHRHYWFADRPLSARVVQAVRHFLVGFTPPATPGDAVVAAAVVALAAILLALRANAFERRAAAFAAALAAAGIVVPILLAAAGHDYVDSRNLLPALVPCAVAVAAGLGARRAGVVGLAAAAVLAALSVSIVAATVGDPLAQRPRWREVAAALAGPAAPRAILLDGSSTWARTLGFYLPRTWWMPPRGARVREIDVLRRLPTSRDCTGTTWWGATCDVGARPPLPDPPARGFRRVSSQRVAGFEIARYRAARPVRILPHAPLEVARSYDHGAAYRRNRHVLLTPRRAPVVP